MMKNSDWVAELFVVLFFVTIVLIVVIAGLVDIRLADAGLEQCITDTGQRVWKRACETKIN